MSALRLVEPDCTFSSAVGRAIRKKRFATRVRHHLQRRAMQTLVRMEQVPADEIKKVLRATASALWDADVPFMVGGGISRWARGGPECTHDVDLLVKPEDAGRALDALEAIGCRLADAGAWGFTIWHGHVCVDLLCSIAEPMGPLVTDDLIMGADKIEFDGVTMRFERPEDDMVSKLFALSEAEPAFGKAVHVARCAREQVDWAEVRRRTQDSPFARAFFEIADGLEITERAAPDEPLPMRLLEAGR